MPKNFDFDISRTGTYNLAPITEGNFNTTAQLPIYWGPYQLNTGFDNYNRPDPNKWRHFEILNIPQVIRFIVCAPDEYEDTDFDDQDAEEPDVIICYGVPLNFEATLWTCSNGSVFCGGGYGYTYWRPEIEGYPPNTGPCF